MKDASAGLARVQRRVLHDAFLLAACVTLLLHAMYFDHTCDDAYISFRYAYNLAHGFGLVFNRGDFTMGYSNPLWVVLLAIGERMSVPSPIAARWLGAACSFGMLALLSLHFRRCSPRALPAFVGLFMLAANGVAALWTFGGLEGPLLALLLVRAVVRAIELPASAPVHALVEIGVCLGLASLTRPEAIVYIAPTCAYLYLRPSNRVAPVRVALVALIAAAFYGALTLWQYAYYGDALPNTYYAKQLPLTPELIGRGAKGTLLYLQAYFWLPLLVCLGFLFVRMRFGAQRGLLPLGMIACFVVFYLSIGGDALVYYRMWHVTLPMVALLAAEIIERLQGAFPARRTAIVFLGATLVAVNLPASFRGWNIEHQRTDDHHLRNLHHVAAYLRRTLPKDARIAANVVGILTYESDLHMVDMLGLTDRHIAKAPGKRLGTPAHESHDARYVLSQAPDVIIPGYPALRQAHETTQAPPPPVFPSDFDLYARPELRRDYRGANLQIGRHGNLPVFVRNSFLARQVL